MPWWWWRPAQLLLVFSKFFTSALDLCFGVLCLLGLLAPFSLGYIKGWRRSCAALIVAHGIRELDLSLDVFPKEYVVPSLKAVTVLCMFDCLPSDRFQGVHANHLRHHGQLWPCFWAGSSFPRQEMPCHQLHQLPSQLEHLKLNDWTLSAQASHRPQRTRGDFRIVSTCFGKWRCWNEVEPAMLHRWFLGPPGFWLVLVKFVFPSLISCSGLGQRS